VCPGVFRGVPKAHILLVGATIDHQKQPARISVYETTYTVSCGGEHEYIQNNWVQSKVLASDNKHVIQWRAWIEIKPYQE